MKKNEIYSIFIQKNIKEKAFLVIVYLFSLQNALYPKWYPIFLWWNMSYGNSKYTTKTNNNMNKKDLYLNFEK